MATLRTLTLGYNENRRRWDLTDDVSNRAIQSFATKRGATQKGTFDRMFRTKPASVKIETQHGRIQEERTYPRSRDPLRSKG
jgi:Uncharacterized protein conserved in bacteria (DUF2188)